MTIKYFNLSLIEFYFLVYLIIINVVQLLTVTIAELNSRPIPSRPIIVPVMSSRSFGRSIRIHRCSREITLV